MAKSAAKPASIPSYEEVLEKLSAELKAAEEQRAHLEAQWRENYMPDVGNLANNYQAYSCSIVAGKLRAWKEAAHWLQTPACRILRPLRLNM
jgi:hypothetical protein